MQKTVSNLERKMMKAEMDQMTSILSAISENPTTGIVVINRNGTVVMSNEAIGTMIGMPATELQGRNFAQMVDIEAGHNLSALTDFTNGTLKSAQFYCNITGYNTIQANLAATRVDPASKELIVLVIADVTALRKLETTAQNANKAKSTFLSNMSHEFRTPLNGILGYVQILQTRSEELPSDVRQMVAGINKSALHLTSLINDVLFLSSIDAGKIWVTTSPVNLSTMLEDTLAIAGQYHGPAQNDVGIQVIPPAEDKEVVMGDEIKIRQILINLISNARKYAHHKVTVRMTHANNTLTMDVIDDGEGIPKDIISSIFEGFVRGEKTQNTPGTGLGLSISQKLAWAMGGGISVENLPEGGCMFRAWITAPLATSETGQASKKMEAPTLSLTAGTNILIVEEDQLNSGVLIEMLVNLGGVQRDKISSVDCASKAVSATRTNCPDIVFLDTEMNSVGATAAAGIRKESPSPPPILVGCTSAGFDEDRRKIEARECYDIIITKPIDWGELMQTIAEEAPQICKALPLPRKNSIHTPDKPIRWDDTTPPEIKKKVRDVVIRANQVEMAKLCAWLHSEGLTELSLTVMELARNYEYKAILDNMRD